MNGCSSFDLSFHFPVCPLCSSFDFSFHEIFSTLCFGGPLVLVSEDVRRNAFALAAFIHENAIEKLFLPVTALHVLHDPAESPGKYYRKTRGPLRPISEVAGMMLAEFLARTQTAYPELEPLAQIECATLEGLPAHTIVNHARRLNASLIVLGGRNQSGFQRLMNGSTTQKVMQLSSTPVTIVKAPGL